MINYHPCFRVTQKRELYVPFIYEGINYKELQYLQRNFKIKKRIEFLNLLYGNLGEVFLRHGHMS